MDNFKKNNGLQAYDLSPVLWLWSPVIMVFLFYVLQGFSRTMYHAFGGENGVIENMTVAFLIIAVVYGLLLLRRASGFPVSWLRWWVLALTAGCIYFAGEEASWGQHYFGWMTPETWNAINDQGETNLHNTSALLDQLPRAMLTLAALIGGIIAPLFFKIKKAALNPDRPAYWLWPTYVCIPCCAMSMIISLPKKVAALSHMECPAFLDVHVGEIKECLLAVFLMLYLMSLYKRLNRPACKGE